MIPQDVLIDVCIELSMHHEWNGLTWNENEYIMCNKTDLYRIIMITRFILLLSICIGHDAMWHVELNANAFSSNFFLPFYFLLPMGYE